MSESQVLQIQHGPCFNCLATDYVTSVDPDNLPHTKEQHLTEALIYILELPPSAVQRLAERSSTEPILFCLRCTQLLEFLHRAKKEFCGRTNQESWLFPIVHKPLRPEAPVKRRRLRLKMKTHKLINQDNF